MDEIESLEVGASLKLPGITWGSAQREFYNAAQAHTQATAGAKQFEVTEGWKQLNGVDVREYTLTRTR